MRALVALSLLLLSAPAEAQFNSYNGVFALNNQSFALRGTPTILSGGTGYAVNDTITLACTATGTPVVRPTLSVSSVASGVITGITVTNAGVSTILPSSDTPATLNGGCTYTQYSTSGSGSGATFSGVLSFIPGGVFGGGTITAGTTPITGTCTSGQYLYNASGIIACQTLSGGGNVSNSGTPTNGQIAIWATATTISGTTLGTNVYSALQAALNGSGGLVGYSGALGTPTTGNLANTSGYAASNLTGTALPAAITTASGLTTVALGTLASGAVTAAYTCPNATTSTLGCAEAGTGLLASGGVFSVNYGTTTGSALQGGGSLGTPSGGNLSNTTNYSAANLASGVIPSSATINNSNWAGTVLSVANGGTGTASPGLIAGTNITSITGTWPNQTINASGGGGGISGPGSVTANNIVTWSTTTSVLDSGNAFGTSGATVGLNNGNNTLSGAVAHTGSVAFTGPGATAATNSTTIMGGTTAPTMGGSFLGALAIGGTYTWPTLTTQQGLINVSATNGLQLGGFGSFYDVVLTSKTGVVIAGIPTGTTNFKIGGTIQESTVVNITTARTWDSGTTPTSPTNGTLTNSNGSRAFVMTATGGTTTMTFTLTAATNRWVCVAQNETTAGATVVATVASNVVTLTNYVSGTATNFAASAVASGICTGT